jgi:protein-S-isoprenylcysteine O-methyltransferase Ste14
VALLASATLVISVLYLGRSFSIVPQARELVTSGRYAIVRHPLYLAEELAIVGIFLQYASPFLLPLLLLHLFLQIQRIRYEERVLERVFPEYTTYASHTASRSWNLVRGSGDAAPKPAFWSGQGGHEATWRWRLSFSGRSDRA